MPKKKSKKKSKRSSSPKKSSVAQRREAALSFMEKTLERTDPIEGLTFLGLTYVIYRSATPVVDIFIKVMARLGGLARDWYPGKALGAAAEGVREYGETIDWQREFSNLGTYEIEELREATKNLSTDITNKLLLTAKGPKLGEWERKAYLYLTYGIGSDPGPKPDTAPSTAAEEYYVAKKIVLEAKIIALMLAMGAAGLLIYFFKSYEWSELMENLPEIRLPGS